MKLTWYVILVSHLVYHKHKIRLKITTILPVVLYTSRSDCLRQCNIDWFNNIYQTSKLGAIMQNVKTSIILDI